MATVFKVEPGAPDHTISCTITAQIFHEAGSPIAQALATLQLVASEPAPLETTLCDTYSFKVLYRARPGTKRPAFWALHCPLPLPSLVARASARARASCLRPCAALLAPLVQGCHI